MGACHLLVLHGFGDSLLMSSCLCDKHFTLWVTSPLLLCVLTSNSRRIPQLLFHWGNKIYPVSSHYRQDTVMEFIFTSLLPPNHDILGNTKWSQDKNHQIRYSPLPSLFLIITISPLPYLICQYCWHLSHIFHICTSSWHYETFGSFSSFVSVCMSYGCYYSGWQS